MQSYQLKKVPYIDEGRGPESNHHSRLSPPSIFNTAPEKQYKYNFKKYGVGYVVKAETIYIRKAEPTNI